MGSNLLRVCLYWLIFLLSGCAIIKPERPIARPTLTPITETHRDLVNLPMPAGRVVAAVYGFRDQTGQFKPAPDSNLSTSVTQGAASLLLKAMRDSRWFVSVEREGLQNLLTERKVARALDAPGGNGQSVPQGMQITLPPLSPASILLEGGIVAYESNVRTGGEGINFLGVGVNEQYRVDQVTVNLRAVDMRTGHIINSVSTTKTIFSQQINSNMYRFVNFKDLLQAEAGYTPPVSD